MSNEAPAPQPDRLSGWLRIADYALTAGYVIAAAVLLVWGGWQRFQLPQAPIIDPDIEGYLGPAVSALAGKPFPHLEGRSFPYPAFIFLILRLFQDFRAIAVVQHVLGVIAGGLVLFAWNAAAALLPSGGIPKALARYMGLAPAYIYLGSATAISFEHQIRPEAIFSFLTILNVWIAFRFMDVRFVRVRPSSMYLGALNVFIACLIYLLKPSFAFAAIISTLPVWLSFVLPGSTARTKAWLAAAAVLPALLFLLLPEHLLKKTDPWGSLFLPETLLTVHASMVEQQMAEDLAANGPLPFSRPVVTAAHDLLSTELEKATHITTPKAYNSLGYNPDYLMYDDSFCIKFQKAMHFSNQEMGNFCMTYYLRALRNHPGTMVKKVERQLGLFYTAKNPAYWLGRNMNLSGLQYARVARLMNLTSQLGPGNAAVARYIETCNRLAGEDIGIPQARRFVEWLRSFSALYLDLLAVALASPLLLLFRPLRIHFLWFVAALWLAFGYGFGNCLTIAVAHSLEVTRYVRSQLIFTAFAECLSIYLLLEIAAFAIRAILARVAPQLASGAVPPPNPDFART
jgi:hypothetical protein